MLRKLSIGSIALVLVSCSGHTFKKMESIDSKMARYSSRIKNPNTIPVFLSSSQKLSQIKSGRVPASSSDHGNIFNALSNKKLYFSTLYNQYKNLRSFHAQAAPEINSCPHFHTTMVTLLDEKKGVRIQSPNQKKYDLTKLDDENYLTQNPELLLPLSYEDTMPRVIDIVKKGSSINTNINNAMAIHLNKTYYELKHLCEYGSSTNYFNFENLMGMKKLNLKKPSVKNMDILLKTTLFSNMMLIKSFKKPMSSRSIASVKKSKWKQLQKPLFSRLKVNWMEDYLR